MSNLNRGVVGKYKELVMKKREINELVGKTLRSIEYNEDTDELEFHTTDEERYLLFHDKDCCEYVYLEDIIGDLADLIGPPIIIAREDTNAEDPGKLPDSDDSYTWTFYNIATIKGHVTLRWYGSSNGYYSESVDFVRFEHYNTFEEAKKAKDALGKDYYIPILGTDDKGFDIYF